MGQRLAPRVSLFSWADTETTFLSLPGSYVWPCTQVLANKMWVGMIKPLLVMAHENLCPRSSPLPAGGGAHGNLASIGLGP